jgi:hypothetical protein
MGVVSSGRLKGGSASPTPHMGLASCMRYLHTAEDHRNGGGLRTGWRYVTETLRALIHFHPFLVLPFTAYSFLKKKEEEE